MQIRVFFMVSVGLHLLLFFPLTRYGSYDFSKPVQTLQTLTVNLSELKTEPAVTDQPSADKVKAVSGSIVKQKTMKPPALSPPPPAEISSTVTPGDPQNNDISGPVISEKNESAEKEGPAKSSTNIPVKPLLSDVPPPLRTADEFTITQLERLNYRISIMGMHIGVAELEAKNDKGEMKISLKVKSTPGISAVYPIDDLIETRHVAGNFIITKIRQQEGSFRSHRGFTIFLRDRSVFWIDLLHNRTSRETIPNSQVLDLMSAFYYLRNRPLQVGSMEELHVYDSDTYTAIPVEVLRREQVSLPAFRHARALVVKPALRTDGIFRRTGDVTIWLTDDEYRVPVRLETSIPLGKITADLVSSQVEKQEPTTPTPPVSPQKQ